MKKTISQAKQILELEAKAIKRIADNVGKEFEQAVNMILECPGRVVTTGMGKIGIVARKISATLASTGTPSVFLHPAEAVHGDLGRVVKGDVILAMSNSGETEEVLRLMDLFRQIEAPVITITSHTESRLAKLSTAVLDLGPIDEACPLGLAPTTSTTAALALGDALAMCVSRRKNFSKDEYALFHPAGELGRKLLKVKDVMRAGKDVVTVGPDVSVREAVVAISSAPQRAGSVLITDKTGRLLGIFTDGDLRRHLETGTDFLTKPVSEVMTAGPKTIQPEKLASEAAALMKRHKIDDLPVTSSDSMLAGLLDIQDLISVGINPEKKPGF